MEINLAGKTLGVIRRRQILRRLTGQVIIWGGLFLGLILVVTAGLNLLVNRQNSGLGQKIKAVTGQIESLQKVETQQVYLNSKLTSFRSLLKTHEIYQSVVETVFALVPTGTSLKGFEVTETGLIQLVGSVPDWVTLSRLLGNISQATGPLVINQASVKKIDFGGTGAVNFSLELAINIGTKND